MSEDEVIKKFKTHYGKVLDSIHHNFKLDTIIDLLAMGQFCDNWAQLHIKHDFIDNGFSMQELQTIINQRINEGSTQVEGNDMPNRKHLSLVVSNDSPKGPYNYPSSTREI